MINTGTYFSKIPQSVLASGTDLDTIIRFVETWAAQLLQISEKHIKKNPDFHAIHPTNKMRQINIDTLRKLNHDLYLSSQQGGHKVFVIYEADRLNRSAANALLKTLEEPTIGSSIFLVTTRPYDLLSTVRSRCWWIQLNTSIAIEDDPILKAWLSDFKQQVEIYLQQKIALPPMKLYGLLYRLQAYIIQKIEQLTPSNEIAFSEEERAAQKSGLEKQCIKSVFQTIEQTLSNIVRMAENQGVFYEIYEIYPQWIEKLENCFRRTEANFSVIPAIEAFLLQFCKGFV